MTPWGSWLSCEEDVSPGHGWVFEVPADRRGLAEPRPLVDLGRFNHEAAVVDPSTGIVYLTEDRLDGLFYRFLPNRCGDLAAGGTLQALGFTDRSAPSDTYNWGSDRWRPGHRREVRWIRIGEVALGTDDLRKRGHRAGAVRFACGEGIHFGDGELFFCVTSGGPIQSGQIMRYVPSATEGQGDIEESREGGQLEIFRETTDPATLNFCDNLVVAPNGHLFVCEDPYFGGEGNFALREIAGFVGPPAPCYVRGITPEGGIYPFARLRNGSELAGVCFSADARTMFVNVYKPALTLAIQGVWEPSPRPEWSLHPAVPTGAPLPCYRTRGRVEGAASDRSIRRWS